MFELKNKNAAEEINSPRLENQRMKELPVQCVARMHLRAKTQTLVWNELFTSGKGDNFETRTPIKKSLQMENKKIVIKERVL